jgi:hypothetical protein
MAHVTAFGVPTPSVPVLLYSLARICPPSPPATTSEPFYPTQRNLSSYTMSTPRHLTRSSVLGKRSLHAVDDDETSPVDDETSDADALPTPNPTPRAKRAKTTIIVEDGTSNKENIPPFVSLLASPSPRRCLRRSATDASVASSSRSQFTSPMVTAYRTNLRVLFSIPTEVYLCPEFAAYHSRYCHIQIEYLYSA